MSVLVVGGGITGLAAALELGRAGVPTLLVEASDRLGGKVGTEHVDGLTIEQGPDSMLTTRPAAVALAREVGLGDELTGVSEPRTVHILRDGRQVPMPDGLGLVLPTKVRPFVGTRLFSWPEKARMALDLVMPRVASADDESVGAFLRRRLGPALVDRLAGPLVGGIYGTAIDELSLDAVVPTLRAAERAHRSLLLAGLADGRRMRAVAAGGMGPPRAVGVFASFRGGLGDLVDATARAASATGSVSISVGTRVISLEPAGTGVRARLSDGRVLTVDAAIITTPGPVAAALVSAFAPRAAAAIATIPHASSTVVTFAYAVEAFSVPPVGHGLLIPASEGLPISALTWSSNKWAGRASAGTVLVRVFLPGEPTGGRAPDGLIAMARAAVERLAPVRRAPELARVSSYEGSMPRYTVGHLGRVDLVERELAAHPSVVLAGAPYHGIGLPDCVAGARVAAAAVLDRLGVAEAIPA
jgi:protoporphyrinogen/coproporphyrinogen III oxidase